MGKIRAFKIYCNDNFYIYSAYSEIDAKVKCIEEVGDEITSIEEIPSSEWDEMLINHWEDNDRETEPFKVSLRECIFAPSGFTPVMHVTNDSAFID